MSRDSREGGGRVTSADGAQRMELSGGAPLGQTAHVDTYIRDNLPPASDWPVLAFSGLPSPRYPQRLNGAVELLDRAVERGHGDRPAFSFEGQTITYGDLLRRTNRIARVLVNDLGIVPGNRVLIHGFNNPTMIACWLAILKVGAIVVTTMPLLRARELAHILERARVSVALCDYRLAEEMQSARTRLPHGDQAALRQVLYFGDQAPEGLEARVAGRPEHFQNVDTAADDVALVAFTSGTTGRPKGTVHFHRDLLAVCDTYSRSVLRPGPNDIFCGTPPLAFTFGLGGLLLFPMHVGASTALLEKPSPEALLELIQNQRVTVLFTSPTMYRALVDLVAEYDVSSLAKCVSAGEPLPLATYKAWLRATGLKIMDGIGSTEMLHIFIAAAEEEIRPGATGRTVPGYEARVLGEDGQPVAAGVIGKLAVRGPTGCRYLADPERQRGYVQNGWNLTGDAYMMDEDGYFWFQARADDMIISSGYNISGPEVENVLLEHPKVNECAVVAAPDPARGHVVKAIVVLRDPADATDATADELQRFVKQEIAPYKYPRIVEFVDALPRTETGKLQRYRLREPEKQEPSSA